MIRHLRTSFPLTAMAAALVAAVALPAGAQSKLPPVRQLPNPTARTTEPLSAVSAAVPLPGGKVLVNDVLQRRVVMFDSALTMMSVVADSTSATANAYGARGGGLLSYQGDSALFIDPVSLSMMVVNPAGELTTVRAVPRAAEINLVVGGAGGRSGFGPDGRLYYRSQNRARPGARNARPSVGNFVIPELPDSAPILGVNLATRKVDTVAAVKIPKVDIKVSQGVDGQVSVQTRINPLPMLDDWALLSDGTIAVVRGHDFHVDWVAPDGNVTSSPKLPFEWQRLSDDDKQMVVDSARDAIEKQRAEAQRLMDGAGGPAAFFQGGGGERAMAGVFGGGGGAAAGGGAPPQRGQGGQGGQGGGGAQGAQGAQAGQRAGGPGGGPGGGFRIPTVNLVPANELPDYRPPFGQQSALGDLDGNLWVRTSAPGEKGGVLYYVIARNNEIIDRIELPQGRILAGFGKNGLLYTGFRDAEGKAYLEVTRWK
ncbi:MAG: hypothetical protein ACKVS7_06725 [Gemmatimonadaceae bacterium]